MNLASVSRDIWSAKEKKKKLKSREQEIVN